MPCPWSQTTLGPSPAGASNRKTKYNIGATTSFPIPTFVTPWDNSYLSATFEPLLIRVSWITPEHNCIKTRINVFCYWHVSCLQFTLTGTWTVTSNLIHCKNNNFVCSVCIRNRCCLIKKETQTQRDKASVYEDVIHIFFYILFISLLFT